MNIDLSVLHKIRDEIKKALKPEYVIGQDYQLSVALEGVYTFTVTLSATKIPYGRDFKDRINAAFSSEAYVQLTRDRVNIDVKDLYFKRVKHLDTKPTNPTEQPKNFPSDETCSPEKTLDLVEEKEEAIENTEDIRSVITTTVNASLRLFLNNRTPFVAGITILYPSVRETVIRIGCNNLKIANELLCVLEEEKMLQKRMSLASQTTILIFFEELHTTTIEKKFKLIEIISSIKEQFGKYITSITPATIAASKEPIELLIEIQDEKYTKKLAKSFPSHFTARVVGQKIILLEISAHSLYRLNTFRKIEKPELANDALLTEDELALLKLICNGHTNEVIAKQFNRSIQTITTKRGVLTGKIRAKGLAGLFEYALKNEYFNIPYRYFPSVKLNATEVKIIEYVCQDYCSKEIANLLLLSEDTVKVYRSAILKKIQGRNTIDILLYALYKSIYQIEGFEMKIPEPPLVPDDTPLDDTAINHDIGLNSIERQIVRYICEDLSEIEIGGLLKIRPSLMKRHRDSILQKTGAKRTAGIVIYAIKNKLYIA